MTDAAWMFPGQGVQQPRMWDAVSGGWELMREASSLLGEDLVERCAGESPESWPCALLQPVSLTVSVAALTAARTSGMRPVAVVGHSLGEYAALVAAGTLSFRTAIEVVRVRGCAMDRAGEIAPGGMLAIVGLPRPDIHSVCEDAGEVWVAGENSPRQTVISGRHDDLELAGDECRDRGAAAVLPLNVPVANHTPLMEPATAPVREALRGLQLQSPKYPFYSGVDADRHTEPGEIASLLVQAITAPVRFSATIAAMVDDGVRSFAEVGLGRTLSRLVRDTCSDVPAAPLATHF